MHDDILSKYLRQARINFVSAMSCKAANVTTTVCLQAQTTRLPACPGPAYAQHKN